MISIKTVEKLTNLIPELVIYYLPCKYNQFLRELNENKCITILKQNIKLYDYKIKKKEYVINKVKIIYYFIENKLPLIKEIIYNYNLLVFKVISS